VMGKVTSPELHSPLLSQTLQIKREAWLFAGHSVFGAALVSKEAEVNRF
jgi:hypothetical protein